MDDSNTRKRQEKEHDADSDQPSISENTIIAGYVLGIANALDHKGIDYLPILRKAGIEKLLTNDPMNRVPASTITKLFKACVEVTRDPYFGMTVARFIHISNFHAFGYSLLASSTLMDACTRIERFFRLVSQNATIHVVSDENQLLMIHDISGEACYESQDAWLAFVVRLMRVLYKKSFNPIRVELVRPTPEAGSQPYLDFYRAPVSFSNEKATLFFDREDMTETLKGGIPDLAQQNENLMVQYLARMDRKDVVMQCKSKIIELLPSGKISKRLIASQLNMSPNNLQLKLSNAGTSYSRLLDEIRQELSFGFLQERYHSISEIAYLLGFSDTSNFTRAFKRWNGLSPSDFRSKKQDTAFGE